MILLVVYYISPLTTNTTIIMTASLSSQGRSCDQGQDCSGGSSSYTALATSKDHLVQDILII